jgi:NhaA family Na+:H+ antiporter
MPAPHVRRRFPRLPSEAEGTFVGALLRQETVGGAVVLAAAAVAVLWANTPLSPAYESLRELHLGPLTVEEWAADGALTLFFYLAGLELKREFVVGSLRRPLDALVPIVAAVAGVATPALVYLVVNSRLVGLSGARPGGWAIPAATDIAFALAVLAVVGSGLPAPLRTFLLTLAVVDDLVVIVIIAVFYTEGLHLEWVAVALGLLGVFAFLQHLRGEHWAWYVPISLATWWAVHESGIHATAGAPRCWPTRSSSGWSPGW